MSRNGSGTYTLPAGNPVVTGTTISSTWANNTLTDIASALTGSLAADGQTTATGNLQMGSNRITGLADGIATTDAATVSQVTASTAGLGTMSTQNANNVAITGGTINGTTIGATTRADGKFTTLAANGDVSFTSTGFLLIPNGTTAQRPASPAAGEIRYNSSLSQYEGYSGSAWNNLGSGAAGSNTQVQYNSSGALAGSSALNFNGTTLATTTLQSTNLSDGTNSTSTTNAIQGSAKAWVNFNGSTAAIRASYNVSSVTRSAAGTYTINFTNSLTDANYAVNATCSANSGNNYMIPIYSTGSGAVVNTPTTSAFTLGTWNNSFGTMLDPVYVCVSVFR